MIKSTIICVCMSVVEEQKTTLLSVIISTRSRLATEIYYPSCLAFQRLTSHHELGVWVCTHNQYIHDCHKLTNNAMIILISPFYL